MSHFAKRGKYMTTSLSDKQQLILEFIKSHIEEQGYPPSVRELCEMVGLRSTATVHSHLNKLQKLGYIKKDPTKPRTISVMEYEKLYIEKIEKLHISQEKKSYLRYFSDFNKTMVKQVLESLSFITPNTALYENNNSSLIIDRVENYDSAIVDLSKTPGLGDLVLVVVNNEYATIKRYYKDGNMVRLALDKDNIEHITLPQNNIDILGTIVGLYKDVKHFT